MPHLPSRCCQWLVVGVLSGSLHCSWSQDRDSVPDPPDGVIFERDIPYRKGHDRWVLNVIRPIKKSSELRPAVMLVHGGGWAMGDQYKFTRLGFEFAKKGYVIVLPTYRMYRDAPFPACLEDLKCAIRWTRAHAEEYGIDPKRIGAYGNSAGGTQALTALLTNGMEELEGNGPHRECSSDLQAVVCSGAVGDMAHPSHSRRAVFAYRNLATGGDRSVTDAEMTEVLRAASPSTYVKNDIPPILVIHGARDEVVIIDSTDDFVASMKSAGNEISYLRFEDGTHGVMGQKAKKTYPAMFAFFEKHL